MSVDTISGSDDFEESVGVGGFALQLDSKGSEQDNLYGSPRCVPEGPRDAIAIGNLPFSAAILIWENAGQITPDDCNRVAAHVLAIYKQTVDRQASSTYQEDTTAAATRPLFTVRPAVLKFSEVCTSFWYL